MSARKRLEIHTSAKVLLYSGAGALTADPFPGIQGE